MADEPLYQDEARAISENFAHADAETLRLGEGEY
jgi:hypothetical protein